MITRRIIVLLMSGILAVVLAVVVGCGVHGPSVKPSQKVMPMAAPRVLPKLSVGEGASATVTVATETKQETRTSQKTHQDASKGGGPALDVGRAASITQNSVRGDTTIQDRSLGEGWLQMLLAVKKSVLAVGVLACASLLSVIVGVLVVVVHARPIGGQYESAVWRTVGMVLIAAPVVIALIGGLFALFAAM